MKYSMVAGLLASFAGVIAACSADSDVEPRQDPPVAVTAPPDAGEARDSAPDAPVAPKSCAAPLVDPACGATKPAPTTDVAIAKFVKDGAVPLRCEGSDDKPLWDLRPLIDLYGAQKIFMMGEVHGTNEIGIVSSLVFEQLASKKLVNVLAMELPMDVETGFQHYVDTGADPLADRYLGQLATNFFGTILTRVARAQAVKGNAIRLAAVDIPYRPESAVVAIQEVAAKLTTQKNNVLTTLPTSASSPPTPADVANVNAYFDHITIEKATICTELSATDCERLVAMTHALWASTLSYDRGGDDALWFARREEVIYYNLKAKMLKATDRMYMHMGAAHTNKHEFSAGSRMSKEYPLTKGQVFSVAPAYGDGSVIWYGQDMPLPGGPETVVGALAQAPSHPAFVSTTRPNASCETNPLGEEPEDSVGGGTRRELYDGYIHYGALTSERRPKDTKLSRDSEVLGGSGSSQDMGAHAAAIVAFRERVEQKEKRAIATGALRRARGPRP